jgi:branched-chain amino acid aminotransferase
MDRANLDWTNLPFGYVKTDCHLEYIFRDGKWDGGKIVYDDMVQLSMAATCLHYGQECFEGIKVFENKDGKVTIFRVEENARRMIRSAEKLLMAPFPEDMFIKACTRVVQLNKRYIPPYGTNATLYIRPLLIGISPLVGVKPASEYMFLVFATPVGPYFKESLKPISLMIEESMDRAAPDGLGDVKVGGNYAASLRVQKKAQELGFKDALYLDPKEKKYIEESSPANFFGITKDKRFVTPDSNAILASITNDSLQVIAEKEMGMKVEKRKIPVEEIFEFKEAGLSGTAAIIAPIGKISWKGKTVTYLNEGDCGKTCKELYTKLTDIQFGRAPDKFGWNHVIPME